MSIESFFSESDNVIQLFIDGSISSGKTTLGKSLVNAMSEIGPVEFYPENGQTSGILEAWLENPIELSAVFQTWMFAHCWCRTMLADERAKTMRSSSSSSSNTPGLLIIDRSLWGNAIFAAVNHHFTKTISDVEYAMYQKMQASKISPSVGQSTVGIYLWVPPSVCIARCMDRDQTAEVEKYDYNYFCNLEIASFVALLANFSSETPFPQLVVDYGNVYGMATNFISIVSGFLQSSRLPTTVHFSTGPPQLELIRAYTSIFDFSDYTVDRFLSLPVVNTVMEALAYTEKYDGPRSVFIQISDDFPTTLLSGAFTLTIDEY